jgi:hypothetical protein
LYIQYVLSKQQSCARQPQHVLAGSLTLLAGRAAACRKDPTACRTVQGRIQDSCCNMPLCMQGLVLVPANTCKTSPRAPVDAAPAVTTVTQDSTSTARHVSPQPQSCQNPAPEDTCTVRLAAHPAWRQPRCAYNSMSGVFKCSIDHRSTHDQPQGVLACSAATRMQQHKYTVSSIKAYTVHTTPSAAKENDAAQKPSRICRIFVQFVRGNRAADHHSLCGFIAARVPVCEQ